jgi:hypothetical protein
VRGSPVSHMRETDPPFARSCACNQIEQLAIEGAVRITAVRQGLPRLFAIWVGTVSKPLGFALKGSEGRQGVLTAEEDRAAAIPFSRRSCTSIKP